MKTRVFLEAIRMESMGVSIGDPWRPDDKSITCVVPLLRVCDEEPTYLVTAQAGKLEIVDSGKIDEATIVNRDDKPVFIRTGELLKGDTQNRTFIQSMVVMPGVETKAKVKCVHASHGIVRGAGFKTNGYSPGRDAVYYGSVCSSGDVNQGSSWTMDRDYSHRIAASVDSFRGQGFAPDEHLSSLGSFAQTHADDLTATRDKYNEVMKDVLAKVPLLDNQIGLVLIDAKGVYMLEGYDLHVPWRAVKEAFVGKESLSITDRNESGVFSFSPEKAKDVIKELVGSAFDDKVVHDDGYQISILTFGDYIGEATVFDGDLIHLGITRKE